VRKPDFFIVGAPKCGTSSLFKYLSEHPNIFLPVRDDMHFFAKDFSPEWDQVHTLDEYLRHFRKVRPHHKAVGERSVYYLFSKTAMRLLRDFDSDARLIALLRNPVDLVSSFHRQMVFMLHEDVEDFETAWRLQESRRGGENIPPTCKDPRVLQYAEVGMLGEQVGRMLECFPLDQVKFVFLDDINASVLDVYKELLLFLGVPYDGRTSFPRLNVRKGLKSRRLARLVLRQPAPIRAVTTGIKRLLRIEQTGIGVALMKWNTRRVEPERLSHEFRRELVKTFRGDVELLARLTGRDLGHWLGLEQQNS
jgi:hypothetical protein